VDHTLIHFEIPAEDVEKLKAFYEKVFGWKIVQADSPIEYWVIQTVPTDEKGMLQHPGVNGGMYKRMTPETKPVNYFSVENIREYLEKIQKLGGKVTQDIQEVPEVGWIAAVEDPQGNAFALLQPIKP
jgi:predicted enzyme related to lactoylglutathione lyase